MKRFKIIVFSILTSAFLLLTFSFAQTSKMSIDGKPKKSMSEIVGVRDVNGRFCAAIKVISDMDGFKYQSNNGVVKVDDMPGRDMVYLSPDERVLEIYHTGYEMFRMILSEYGIQLHPKEVWVVRIKGAPKTGDLLPVTIIANPADAQIIIDGKNVQSGKPVELTKSSHTLIIKKDGYKTVNKTITVSKSNVLFNEALSEMEIQAVQIKSVPSGAQILIDGQVEGQTDKGIWKYPGNYSLKLIKPGYAEINETIIVKEVTGQAQNTFSYTLTKNSGSLQLTVTPADASVLINKKDYTSASFGDAQDKSSVSGNYNIELAPGRYKVEISKTGYYPKSEAITIERGRALNKSFNLIAKSGKLQFNIQPLSANVTLKQNGRTVRSWTGMKYLKNLQAGSYELECTASGYESEKRNITIEEGKKRVLDMKLVKISNLSSSKSVSTKSAAGNAFVKSLFVPGWGQISNGHKRGWLYLAATLGAAGWYYSAYSAHSENMGTYNKASDFYSKTQAYKEADDSYKNGMIPLYVLGGVYAINLLDALFFSSRIETKTYSIRPYLNKKMFRKSESIQFGLAIKW